MTRQPWSRLNALPVVVACVIAQLTPPAAAAPPYSYSKPHEAVETGLAGAGLSMSGKAFMWYRDGTVTAGSTRNPDDWRTPYYYSTPPGKVPNHIVGMAISSKDKVYAWYKDGTRSVGASGDLDAYESPRPYALPYKPGTRTKYAPEDIVDMSISVYDTVFTYFNDGYYTQGTSTHLWKHQGPKPYAAANNRDPKSIIAIAGAKGVLPGKVSWYWDGYYALGNPQDLGTTKGLPFSQHLTIYASKTAPGFTDNGFWTPVGSGDVHVVRELPGPSHEPVLAPGMTNIALARGVLEVWAKSGEILMQENPSDFFNKFLAGSSDPVTDVNSFTGMGDCKNGYPQTLYNQGFCIFQAYDTRAAFDKKGGRFVFLANARNYVWQGEYKKPGETGCSKYIAPSGKYDEDGDEIGEHVYSSEFCGKGRRHLLIAVSKSEDPKDGFHTYAVKENNYRDWPLLAVRGDQLIVGLAGDENPDGYVAIVFNLAEMREGAKRPRYFKLYKGDVGQVEQLRFPRRQAAGAPLTIAVGSDGRVRGFSEYAVGYSKPQIVTSSLSVPASIGYTLSHGALRITNNNRFGVNELTYGRYPMTITGGSIQIFPYSSMGAYPLDTFGVSTVKYKTFNCARLAIAGNGAEVFGFAGAYKPSASSDKLKYAAAYVRRRGDDFEFSAPAAYKAGSAVDPGSYTGGGVTVFNEKICGQQGAAEADPANAARVWVLHNYGLEDGDLKSALARIDTY